VLQVSYSSVARWLKNPERKRYTKTSIPTSTLIIETIKTAVDNDPFITILKLMDVVKTLFSITLSRELIRTAIIKSGLSRKKARFFSRPKDMDAKVKAFLEKRALFQKENRFFVSLDETSFGRRGRQVSGYAPKGKQLRLPRNAPHMTTVSSLVVASSEKIIKRQEVKGSFNTKLFTEYIESMSLPRGTVILLDNVAFHHSNVVKDLVSRKGYELLFVPPYSPWYNPIEGIFSIIKRRFYKGENIDTAFESVTPEHCRAFFRYSFREFEIK
jgi:transposase